MARFEIIKDESVPYPPNNYMRVEILKDKETGVLYLVTNGGQAITPILDSAGRLVVDRS